MDKISVVILTFNEERNIARCLQSVKGVADEILVVDSYSTDRTREICLEFSARFVQHTFEGYIEQKNYAASLASNNLILSLDADEALSEKLRQSIEEVKLQPGFVGYTMNRLTNYCGKWIRHSGWYPDKKLRLFNRKMGKWGGLNPHDKFVPFANATINHLKGDLLHYSYYTKEEHLRQIEKFSDIAASALNSSGVKSDKLKILYKPIARFIKSYVINSGFLDGKEGFTIARLTAKASYLRYQKLYNLQHNK